MASVHWDTAAFFRKGWKGGVLPVRNSILLFCPFCWSFSGRLAFRGEKKKGFFQNFIRTGLSFKMLWLEFPWDSLQFQPVCPRLSSSPRMEPHDCLPGQARPALLPQRKESPHLLNPSDCLAGHVKQCHKPPSLHRSPFQRQFGCTPSIKMTE